MLDSVLYLLFRSLVFLMRLLPLSFWLALARLSGSLYYLLDSKKAALACVHLQMALPQKTAQERRRIIGAMYKNFAQSIVETLYAPCIDISFIRRHVKIPDWGIVEEALKTGKGIVFLGCHAGSWELSNMGCALLLGEDRYAMLVRPQGRTKKIDGFLNDLRASKGCGIIRVNELKKMVEHLSRNKILGAVADHGGRDGVSVPFFGRLAMTPTGSLKLAKKFGSGIILAFMHRKGSADHELFLKSFAPCAGTDDESLSKDLTAINAVFEEWIRLYPEEYLWFFRRWKYSPQRRLLILSDGKAGHFRQSQALADMIRDLGWLVEADILDVRFKTRDASRWLALIARLFGARFARACLRLFLEEKVYGQIERKGIFDVVISAGSTLAGVNIACASAYGARSAVIMKPGLLAWNQVDLIVIPEHDRPPSRRNVVRVIGSLNSISPSSMRQDYECLVAARPDIKNIEAHPGPKVGLLTGGDSKLYRFDTSLIEFLARQVGRFLEKMDGRLMVTTSRRTPAAVTDVLKRHFAGRKRCPLFVDAAEDNPVGTVGGILHACDVIIVSGESISMISEAVASGKYIVVFEPHRLVEHNKVRRFLEKLQTGLYIYLVKCNEIYDKLSWIVANKPARPTMNARAAVSEKLKKIL